MFVNQLAYFVAISNSIYSEQVKNPYSPVVGEDIRRLDSVLWAVKLGTDYDSEYCHCMDVLTGIFETVVTSYSNHNQAAMKTYLTMFRRYCEKIINDLDAE